MPLSALSVVNSFYEECEDPAALNPEKVIRKVFKITQEEGRETPENERARSWFLHVCLAIFASGACKGCGKCVKVNEPAMEIRAGMLESEIQVCLCSVVAQNG